MHLQITGPFPISHFSPKYWKKLLPPISRTTSNITFLKNSSLVSALFTALVRVTNDLRIAADVGSPSLLILFSLSAAFDTVDHDILLNRLHQTTGLADTALNWFKSYLTNRTEYISLGNARSRQHTVTCGVPQGSVLGPILFTIYILPLGHIISRLEVYFHCYADDTQL